MTHAQPIPLEVPKWAATPGVFILFLGLLAVPVSARTVTHFPASQTIVQGQLGIGTFPDCLTVQGDSPQCAWFEVDGGNGTLHNFTLKPTGLFPPQLWVTNGTDHGCNISQPYNCINEIPDDGNATYTYTEYCPQFLPADPACSYLQYWDTNGTDHYYVQSCVTTPHCGPFSAFGNITLTEYSHALYVDTNVSAPAPTLGVDLFVNGTLCDPDGTNSYPVTLAWSNISDADGTPNCTINKAALDLLEIGFRGMCVQTACDELRNTQGGVNVEYQGLNYRLNLTYDWVGLSRVAPTELTLIGRATGNPAPRDNVSVEIYNWTAGDYDSIGTYNSTVLSTLTYIPNGTTQISANGTLRVRFLDSITGGDENLGALRMDYAAVTQQMPDLVQLPSPLLDWMLILILLILWVSFSAIGIAKPSGLLFMGGALCGIVLAFFFVLPMAALPGMAVLGLAMTCMLGGVGIAISSGGEAG